MTNSWFGQVRWSERARSVCEALAHTSMASKGRQLAVQSSIHVEAVDVDTHGRSVPLHMLKTRCC